MRNPGLKYGVFCGAVIVLLMYIFAQTNPEGLFYYGKYVFWGLYLIAMFLATFEARRQAGGFISFRPALRPAFLTFVVASLQYFVFYYALVNYVDTSIIEIEREVAISAIESTRNMVGDQQVEDMIETIQAEDYGFHLSDMLWAYVRNLIFPGFIFALFVAFLVRKQ